MRSRFQFLIFFLTLLLVPAVTWTQKASREDYISTYNKLAIDEMKRSGIPASVTLAQGLLESDNGNSTLATRGNNHFGIKCHDWKGKKIFHDDDKKNECFRKYKTVKESYVDHTDFLMGSPRYSFLFEMDHNDYKGWSKGLKKAGYATSPKYSDLLIRIIEENELYRFDGGKVAKPEETDPTVIADIDEFEIAIDHRKILVRNRINYIIVKEGDTYQSITSELALMPFELAKYNEIPRDSKLNRGEELYLQPKRGKSSVEFRFHTVEEGETMYRISQMYGIKLKKLYRKNLMKEGEEPGAGTVLNLRKTKKVELSEETLPLDQED